MQVTVAAHNDRDRMPVGRSGGPERRCIVTRAVRPKRELLRFVVDPDGRLVVDIAGDLPGRGLWVTADRETLERACRRNLFQAAARAPIKVPDHLVDTVEAALARRCLDAIGLARRAGEAVAGFEKVRGWLRTSQVGLMLSASDGAADGRAKLRALAGNLPVIDLFSAAELGGAFGRDSLVHVAIARGGVSACLVTESSRLAGLRRVEGHEKVD
jgi:predicted RNA-binding protein YlxR (DUF448 family)